MPKKTRVNARSQMTDPESGESAPGASQAPPQSNCTPEIFGGHAGDGNRWQYDTHGLTAALLTRRTLLKARIGRLRIAVGKVLAGTEGGWALGASVAGAAFLWLRVL